MIHGESSWQMAWNGCPYDAQCSAKLNLDDIFKDIERIKCADSIMKKYYQFSMNINSEQ